MTTDTEYRPASQEELQRYVAAVDPQQGQPLNPQGGRTALHWGYPLATECQVVSTKNLNRLVDYPARDMTITVGAGMTIEELAQHLAPNRQQLPIDVPVPKRATLGGLVATNVSGPRRYGYGTLRDYLIGVTAVDGKGRLFHAGGRVVKNVAGYDLCKLMIGSLGTLGIVTELTLKLRPQPHQTAVTWCSLPTINQTESVLSRLSTSATRPVILDVLNPLAAAEIASQLRGKVSGEGIVLVVGFEGDQSVVDWQVATLRDELSEFDADCSTRLTGDDAALTVEALTEFQSASDAPLTFVANLRPSQSVEFLSTVSEMQISLQLHAGNGIAIGHLPDTVASVEDADILLSSLRSLANRHEGNFASVEDADILLSSLRSLANRHEGNLVICSCADEWKAALPVFGESQPSWVMMEKIRQELDPHNLMNPGRFVNV